MWPETRWRQGAHLFQRLQKALARGQLGLGVVLATGHLTKHVGAKHEEAVAGGRQRRRRGLRDRGGTERRRGWRRFVQRARNALHGRRTASARASRPPCGWSFSPPRRKTDQRAHGTRRSPAAAWGPAAEGGQRRRAWVRCNSEDGRGSGSAPRAWRAKALPFATRQIAVGILSSICRWPHTAGVRLRIGRPCAAAVETGARLERWGRC